jgi:hypothetical protein
MLAIKFTIFSSRGVDYSTKPLETLQTINYTIRFVRCNTGLSRIIATSVFATRGTLLSGGSGKCESVPAVFWEIGL